jgi:hypothetical protein
MTIPIGPAPQSTDRLEQDLAQLRREVDELQRKPLRSAPIAAEYSGITLYRLFESGVSAVNLYSALPSSQITTEKTLWSGRIPVVVLPLIEVDGVWGQASGSVNVTYNLKVGGVTVGTWVQTGTFSAGRRGPFNIGAYLGVEFAAVDLTAVATGTGSVACQVMGCAQRQV